MTDFDSITVKTKTSKKAYESGETIATTLRISPELRIAWFHEVGRRMLQSKVGIGWKQTPSTQQIVVEDLANRLGVELPKEILKKPEHEESGVIRYMLNLPKSVHEKIHDLALIKGDSFNNVALNLLKLSEYVRQQERKENIKNGAVTIQIKIPEDIYNRYKQRAASEYKTVESYVAIMLENQMTEKKIQRGM